LKTNNNRAYDKIESFIETDQTPIKKTKFSKPSELNIENIEEIDSIKPQRIVNIESPELEISKINNENNEILDQNSSKNVDYHKKESDNEIANKNHSEC